MGAAFFCPACGHNSVITTFDASVRGVRQLVESLASVREALRESSGIDVAEDAVRQVLENSLVKLVGSFQRLAEAKFVALPQCAELKFRKNAFQNIAESSELWHRATGTGYDALVSDDELTELRRLFQQRHLLVHKEGIVDQDYIDRTGDTGYSLGQRVIVREQTVLALADIVTKLADAFRMSGKQSVS